ncbi:MAG: head decoration protein [Gammaproteobacteria bacterium]|uniref:Putative head decoration protein n=1 Tax=viral metagenome TaxID=1070528 RepID=A0A6H1ZXN5_9ZZZZ|nr:head decoration protein [Gammaproteobacteria bacterium]MBU2157116.1 head decoration protein [Gammaproteobacteria bacterium]MBU2256030.1 head decoration protein [Gammaproteobacteria bacterium]MBU2295098.1 head decoration protein [Gammaproteobacteria bacterium]
MKITNHLNADGFRVQNLADAVDPQDAVSKAQLDAAVQGWKWKEPVRAASTANITLSGAQTIDGVSVVAGDRVLVKDQSTGSANGIYVAATGAWSRAADFDAGTEVVGATVFVSEGTANGNSQWHMTTDGPITIGTTGLVWAQVGGGASYTAGAGIDITGGVISIDPAVVARKVSATIGDNSATTISITHNFGTRDLIVSVREVSSNAGVIADWVANTDDTVQITFGVAPTTGQYRVTVVA